MMEYFWECNDYIDIAKAVNCAETLMSSIIDENHPLHNEERRRRKEFFEEVAPAISLAKHVHAKKIKFTGASERYDISLITKDNKEQKIEVTISYDARQEELRDEALKTRDYKMVGVYADVKFTGSKHNRTFTDVSPGVFRYDGEIVVSMVKEIKKAVKQKQVHNNNDYNGAWLCVVINALSIFNDMDDVVEDRWKEKLRVIGCTPFSKLFIVNKIRGINSEYVYEV
ncbi:MAG: hypothetical protein GY804_12170 [Alphaproteobacteria bacterium]|nr:hypothetical protein [Alphaproteobacteria bacterium]